MRKATYWALQLAAAAICGASTLAFSQTPPGPVPSLSDALVAVGIGDWIATALVSLSFGLVSMLQRFKRSEAGEHFILFVAAHMSGSLISGVIVYLMTQGAFDSPNRFVQALAIGAAGWGGSTVADKIADRINKTAIDRAGGPPVV